MCIRLVAMFCWIKSYINPLNVIYILSIYYSMILKTQPLISNI